MQDINLLQNKLKDKTNQWEKSNRAVLAVLGLVLVAELAVGGFFFFMKGSAEKEKAALDQDNISLQGELARLESDLGDAKAFQAQSKNIAVLLSSHVNWTKVIEELASTAYKSSQTFALNTSTTGQAHMEGMVKDYNALGKMLLSLESSDLFTSSKLTSAAPSNDEQEGITYSVDVTVNDREFISDN